MLPFLLVNANETSIASKGPEGTRSLTRSVTRWLAKYFIYGNYNVPYYKLLQYGNYNVSYYNAADQCIRLSPKMASFAAENTQDNVFRSNFRIPGHSIYLCRCALKNEEYNNSRYSYSMTCK